MFLVAAHSTTVQEMEMEMKNRLMAVAAIAALAQGGAAMNNSLGRRVFPRISARRPSKRYPQMVTSTAEEIREHNRNVNTRQVRRYEARHAA